MSNFGEYVRRPLRDRLRDSMREDPIEFWVLVIVGVIGILCTTYSVYLMWTTPM